MDNATTFATVGGKRVDSPRAYAHRSHSGQYGIVNSEEGFQNLTRFLFGSVRADGWLDVFDVTLPEEVQAGVRPGPRLGARLLPFRDRRRPARQPVAAASPRRARELGDQPHLRRAVPEGRRRQARRRAGQNSPHLFSLFLDPTKSQKRHQSVAFAFDVAILVPDYEIDGVLWLKKHFEGGYLVRKLIVVEASSTPPRRRAGGSSTAFQSETPNDTSTLANARLEDGALKFEIPIASPVDARPSVSGQLRIEIRNWS